MRFKDFPHGCTPLLNVPMKAHKSGLSAAAAARAIAHLLPAWCSSPPSSGENHHSASADIISFAASLLPGPATRSAFCY
jgi:hypothetical protein